MIRVIICDADLREGAQLRNLVEKAATSHGVLNKGATVVDELAKVEDLLARYRDGFFSLVLFRERDSQDGVLAFMRDLRNKGYTTPFALATPVEEHAADSYELHAAFFPLPGGYAELAKAINPIVSRWAGRPSETLLVKSRKGLDNVVLDEILFVETSSNGLLIHLPNDQEASVRTSMQNLFERMGGDERFVKAGSSFIVNLNNIRSLSESSVVFAGGETIIVPVRARKPLKDAFEEFCLRPVAS